MNRNTGVAVIIIKWLLGIALTYVALWTARVAPDWTTFPDQKTAITGLFLAAYLLVMLETEVWGWLARQVRLSSWLLRGVSLVLLGILLLLVLPTDLTGRSWVLGSFLLLVLTLALITLMMKERTGTSLGNLAVSLVSLAIMAVIVELAAPAATDFVADAQHQNAVDAALENARSPMAPEDMEGQGAVRQTRSPQWELTTPGGGPAWGELTGWGTHTDAVMHYWMDGVYDVEVVYNSLGFRGPEIPYDRPDDVYRILIVGDSFVEAREVAYSDTFYAQLNQILAEERTIEGQQIQVFAVGAVGWGTLHAYLYYHHEGYLFSPDLVIHTFFINDVTDNHPKQFYPERNMDFAVSDEEDRVELLNEATASESTQIRSAVRWLDALPGSLGDTATVALLRRIIDPPREMVTLVGNLGQWHPQNFIFARLPEIEGYPEAWRRTGRAYEIWATEARANQSDFMVLAIDYPEEKVTELAATFISGEEQTWVWDADLPYTRLAEILGSIDVPLILTRERYAEYAHSVGLRPYDALYYLEDGHWNPTGHQITAQIIADALANQGILEAQ